jgi:hypothetical protein
LSTISEVFVNLRPRALVDIARTCTCPRAQERENAFVPLNPAAKPEEIQEAPLWYSGIASGTS